MQNQKDGMIEKISDEIAECAKLWGVTVHAMMEFLKAVAVTKSVKETMRENKRE